MRRVSSSFSLSLFGRSFNDDTVAAAAGLAIVAAKGKREGRGQSRAAAEHGTLPTWRRRVAATATTAARYYSSSPSLSLCFTCSPHLLFHLQRFFHLADIPACSISFCLSLSFRGNFSLSYIPLFNSPALFHSRKTLYPIVLLVYR